MNRSCPKQLLPPPSSLIFVGLVSVTTISDTPQTYVSQSWHDTSIVSIILEIYLHFWTSRRSIETLAWRLRYISMRLARNILLLEFRKNNFSENGIFDETSASSAHDWTENRVVVAEDSPFPGIKTSLCFHKSCGRHFPVNSSHLLQQRWFDAKRKFILALKRSILQILKTWPLPVSEARLFPVHKASSLPVLKTRPFTSSKARPLPVLKTRPLPGSTTRPFIVLS